MQLLAMRLLVCLSALLLTATIAQSQTARATITFDNQSGQLALVKVMVPSNRQVTVPNNQRRTVKVVGGSYYILTRYGAKKEDYTYSKGDRFNVTQTRTRYSIITITLHKVVDGNYH